MPRYHLANGSTYFSNEQLSPEELDHLSGTTKGNDAAQPAEPSLLDRIGGWRGLAGGAIRAGSGILAAEGGLPGAAISGAGEALAELAEGSPFSPTKIGVESGFGAVPFGKIVKGGKVLGSALRSGALGAAHSAVSDIAGGEAPSIGGIATAGGLGALFGAGGSALAKGAPVAPKLVGQLPKVADEAGTRVWSVPPEAVTNQVRPNLSPSLQSGYSDTVRSSLGKLLKKAPSATERLSDIDANIAATKVAAEKTRTQNFRTDVAAKRTEDVADVANLRATIAAEAKAAKASEEADRLAKIQGTIEDQGLVPSKPQISQSISATGEGGEKLSARTAFKKPKADEAGTWTEESPLAATEPTVRPVAEPRMPVMDEPPGAVPPADLPPTGAPATPQSVGKRQGASKVQKFNRSIQDILSKASEPSTAAPELPAPPALAQTPAEAPTSQVAKLFKSPVDVVGEAYRGAKAEPDINPLAKQQLGVALQSEANKAGLPTRGPGDLAKFLGQKVEPELSGSMERTVSQPQPAEESWKGIGPSQTPRSGGADWIQEQLGLIDQLKKLGGSESGAVSPKASALLGRVGAGGLGAFIGAPVGSWANPDDPEAALKGAAAGGMLGFAGMGGAQRALESGQGAVGGAAKELINYRNAGLLSSPSAQLKKPLSDLSAVAGEGLERVLTRGKGEQGMNILKELFRAPTNVSNYMQALRNPELAGEVIGDAMRSSAPPEQDLLGMVGRPFGAAQYSTQKILERAGIPLDEARKILFLGDPETKLGKYWLSAQDPRKTGQTGSALVRAVRPFTRIATNLAERGVQRIPGVSMFTGDPETRLARTVIGTGAMGLGGLTGMSDVADEESDGEPTSPMIRGLRRAALASYALPFIAGESMMGPRGARDLYYAIPGLNSPIQPPAPKDTLFSLGGKQLRGWLDQMLPSWANPTDAERPLR